jgi:universal stress protein A
MPKLERILVPIDNSRASRAALDYALFLGRMSAAQVEVLHVSDRGADGSREITVAADTDAGSGESLATAALARGAAGGIDDLFAELEAHGRISLDAYLDFEDVGGSIVTAAKGYDLVVMGTHGRTGLDHLLNGSVAEKVVRMAECPVVTVHAET